MKSLADRLRAGETIYSAWANIPDPMTADAVAETDFDAVTLEMQHGGQDERGVQYSVAGVLRHGKPAIVRIPVDRFDMASRALDFGADAVIAPMINSVEDARKFAAAMKYPPVGERSWGPTRALSVRGLEGGNAYLKSANSDTMALAMIETRQAYEAVDDIIGVGGIDGVFVGPSDFSIAWSNGGAINPGLEDMMPAIADIARKATDAGKFAAIYVIDPALCAGYREMGYRLLAIGSETRYMSLGAKQLLDAAKAG